MADDSFPVLETDRLLLRLARPSDADAVFRIYSDPEVMRYYNMEPFTDMAQAVAVVERRDERFHEELSTRWAICLRETDEMIGSAGLQPWHHAWQFAELGYDLARDYWGRGYMGEALKAILRYGFRVRNLHRVEAEIMPKNLQSQRVLQKLGFTREGLLRERGFWKGEHHDLIIFSLLSHEFRA